MADDAPETLSEFYDQQARRFISQDRISEAIGLIQSKNDHERNLLDQDRLNHEKYKMLLEAVIALAQFAIRSLMLLNGGAAIALLAFTGHLASTADPEVISNLSRCVIVFGSGAGITALIALLAYLSQSSFTEAHRIESATYEAWGIGLRWAGIVLAFVAAGLFFWGLLEATSTAFLVSELANAPNHLISDSPP